MAGRWLFQYGPSAVARCQMVSRLASAHTIQHRSFVSSCRSQVTVSEYLATRLRESHCDHVFSVAGSYSTEFLDGMGEAVAGPNMQRLQRIGNTNETEAAYAAEGYAKARGGVGAICVSYGAGLLGTVNGVTSAHIERVPLVVINGAPTDLQYRQFTENDVMPYHLMYQEREGDKRVFTPITCEQVVLGNTKQIPYQIDNAFQSALTTRQPIYIEVSRNQFNQLVDAPVPGRLVTSGAVFDDDPAQVAAAVDMIWQALQSSKRPLLYGGVELVRYGCAELFGEFVKRSRIHWITDPPAKSLLSEHDPLFAGVYCGKMSDASTLQYVKEKDFVLQLGVWNGQLSTAGVPVDQFLGGAQYVLARHNAVIGQDRRVMGSVSLKGLLTALLAKFKSSQALPTRPSWQIPPTVLPTAVGDAQQPSFDSFRSLLGEANSLLKESVVCVDATFGFLACMSLPVAQHHWFNETTYAIIGWSSGAAVGIALGQGKRVLVLVGDGGLMNCPTGISTAALHNLDIVYLVFDNRVYAVDQFFADTKPFKDPKEPFTGAHCLPTWNWVKLAESWGATGHYAKTNKDLRAILKKLENARGTHVVQISIDAHAFLRNLKSLI